MRPIPTYRRMTLNTLPILTLITAVSAYLLTAIGG